MPPKTKLAPNQKYRVWLKSSAEWFSADGHVTYVKQRPKCDVEFKRMTRPVSAQHTGPYCCTGDACPEEHTYGEAQKACDFPAHSPWGVPRLPVNHITK